MAERGGRASEAGGNAASWGSTALAVAAVAVGLMCSPAHADKGDCVVPHFKFNAAGETWATMSLRRGVVCPLSFWMASSTKGLAGIISSTIVVRPKNGMLGEHDVRLYAYKADENFVGNDEFEISIRYNLDDGEGDHETLLKMNVSVY